MFYRVYVTIALVNKILHSTYWIIKWKSTIQSLRGIVLGHLVCFQAAFRAPNCHYLLSYSNNYEKSDATAGKLNRWYDEIETNCDQCALTLLIAVIGISWACLTKP